MIKGNKINLVPATLDFREKVYKWCFKSETTASHSGPPDYPNIQIPTYKEFCDTYYEDYFFTGEKPNKGRGFIVMNGNKPVGFISYSSFHLKPNISEAVKSYEKAGFKKTNKSMSDFLLEEYNSLYGAGDYGKDETCILIKYFNENK